MRVHSKGIRQKVGIAIAMAQHRGASLTHDALERLYLEALGVAHEPPTPDPRNRFTSRRAPPRAATPSEIFRALDQTRGHAIMRAGAPDSRETRQSPP